MEFRRMMVELTRCSCRESYEIFGFVWFGDVMEWARVMSFLYDPHMLVYASSDSVDNYFSCVFFSFNFKNPFRHFLTFFIFSSFSLIIFISVLGFFYVTHRG